MSKGMAILQRNPFTMQKVFNEAPDFEKAADLLTVADEWWAEDRICDGEFQNVVRNVRDWLRLQKSKKTT